MAQASILLSQVGSTAMQLQASDHTVMVDRPKESEVKIAQSVRTP